MYDKHIILASGRKYDLRYPEKNEIYIEDIARGLSNICRFNGQLLKHYSVAQHSVYVSKVVQDKSRALDALLHDAAEAYLGDITSPLKSLLPDYREIERAHERHIFKTLGISWPLSYDVHVADVSVFNAEVRDLRGGSGYDVDPDIPPMEAKIVPWPSELAYCIFMRRYNELRADYKPNVKVL